MFSGVAVHGHLDLWFWTFGEVEHLGGVKPFTSWQPGSRERDRDGQEQDTVPKDTAQ
jgi:hypothetical protein